MNYSAAEATRDVARTAAALAYRQWRIEAADEPLIPYIADAVTAAVLDHAAAVIERGCDGAIADAHGGYVDGYRAATYDHVQMLRERTVAHELTAKEGPR